MKNEENICLLIRYHQAPYFLSGAFFVTELNQNKNYGGYKSRYEKKQSLF